MPPSRKAVIFIEITITALYFNALDFATGLIKAFKNKTLDSKSLRDGLFKKCGFMLCYALAWLVDTHGASVGIDIGSVLLPVICGYVVMTEIVSIIENIAEINPEILPEKLMELFKINKK